MFVKNFTNYNGRAVPNQFIITEEGRGALGNFIKREIFQSYDNIIAIITYWEDGTTTTEIDERYWDYSTTTGKYRNLFLKENKNETLKKIENKTYILDNLNK